MAKRVIIVDDSPSAAAQLCEIVDGLPGFEVVGEASNGAEGLRLFRDTAPDIVCMDIVMPTMDGLQAARAILQGHPDATVFMISSIADMPSKLSTAIEIGARDILSKPFVPEDVRAMLLTAQ